MGLFDLFWKTVKCPFCGAAGAKQRASHVRCPNSLCPHFDRTLLEGGAVLRAAQAGSGSPLTLSTAGDQVAVRYLNFRGKQQTFVADRNSIVRKRNHLSLRLAPKGRRVALSRDRIQNLVDVEQYASQKIAPTQDWPSPRERQVLNYHKKHKTTSPLYESVRRKYPDW